MDFTSFSSLVTSVGFPIVMCGAMGWYVKYTSDKQREELKNVNEQHDKEMINITTALNNNTLALQKLCDMLERN